VRDQLRKFRGEQPEVGNLANRIAAVFRGEDVTVPLGVISDVVAFQQDLLLEMWPEAGNPSGNLVHVMAQAGHQRGLKKVSDEDKSIILERRSPSIRCVLHRTPPLRRMSTVRPHGCVRRKVRIGITSRSCTLPKAHLSFYALGSTRS
jgi:hypothetical protein